MQSVSRRRARVGKTWEEGWRWRVGSPKWRRTETSRGVGGAVREVEEGGKEVELELGREGREMERGQLLVIVVMVVVVVVRMEEAVWFEGGRRGRGGLRGSNLDENGGGGGGEGAGIGLADAKGEWERNKKSRQGRMRETRSMPA